MVLMPQLSAQRVATGSTQEARQIDFLCYEGPSTRTMVFRSDSPFGGNRLLHLKVQDTAHLLPTAATPEIFKEAVFSLLLWRRMCLHCAIGSAGVVLFNDKIFADEAIIGLVHVIDYNHIRPRFQPPEVDLGCPTCPLAPPKRQTETDLTMTDIMLNGHLNDRVPLSDYEPFDSADPDGQRLCKVPLNQVPEELLGLRQALRCANQRTPAALPLIIRVLNGPSPECGTDKSVVGCESSGSLVELNAHEFTYVTHQGVKVFGAGPDQVDLEIVLLHEMGHWTGILKHLPEDGNIMYQYINLARCIDKAVVTSLSNATSPKVGAKPLALRYFKGALR